MNVLIVDDSRLARMALSKLLSKLRPDCVRREASNADEAIAMVGEYKADLVLLDYNMPGRDGLSLAAELRRLMPSARLALVSANQQEEILAGAESIGAAFLSKPVTSAALSQFLETLPRVGKAPN